MPRLKVKGSEFKKSNENCCRRNATESMEKERQKDRSTDQMVGDRWTIIFLIVGIFMHRITMSVHAAAIGQNYETHSEGLKVYDIWNAVDVVDGESANTVANDDDGAITMDGREDFDIVSSNFGTDFELTAKQERGNVSQGGAGGVANVEDRTAGNRKGKVIHLFPVPVDGECLADDGRRTGTCFNAYECRQKGGTAKGECAMGFGVCCIFIANCNETISNNITYLVSPNFPSFMPNNFTTCRIKVQMMSDDISQLRIDFHHFSLGQPNRRSGVCDGDVFNVTGGPGGTLTLCGQNSGQHVYYDVGGRSLPRQSPTLYGSLRPLTYEQLYPNRTVNGTNGDQSIEIIMSFTQRFLPIRIWEIRVAQIPFSMRAPAGCLQYHTGPEGVIQTFNFADNGRHLANQNYRICMRQEVEMCSIVYQPCDEESFRIGPGGPLRTTILNGSGGGGGGGTGDASAGGGGGADPSPGASPALDSNASGVQADGVDGADDASTPTTMSFTTSTTTTTTTTTTTSTTTTTTAAPETSAATESSSTTAATTTANTTEAAVSTTTTPAPSSPLNDEEVEGSGDNDIDGGGGIVTPPSPAALPGASRRPRPVSGGFDLFGLLRSAFDFGYGRRQGRQLLKATNVEGRQFYSTCSDRITMPCIIEDFIGTGLGPLPGCEPVHCGSAFCSSGTWPCRIESTVTPFYIGVHFGSGESKGSAEDNIGACLRYTQMQCT